jgi:hypothetical protein
MSVPWSLYGKEKRPALTKKGIVPNGYRRVDSIDETWQVNGHDHDKGSKRSPVHTAVVTIDALILVKHWDVQAPTTDNPIIRDLDQQVSLSVCGRR